MAHIRRTLATIAVLLAAVICGCSNNAGNSSTQDSGGVTTSGGEHSHGEGEDEHEGEGGEHGGEGRAEHDREGGESGGEAEESGTELTLADRYDNVRNGARLILAYDAESKSFQGTVENTTGQTLERVRVEVHLSNGKELGPTTPGDLKPGEKREVTLTPESKDFDGWSAHPEVGNEEHAHGGEHGEEGGEHGGEGRGEHK